LQGSVKVPLEDPTLVNQNVASRAQDALWIESLIPDPFLAVFVLLNPKTHMLINDLVHRHANPALSRISKPEQLNRPRDILNGLGKAFRHDEEVILPNLCR